MRRNSRITSERGQSVVEFALVLPALMLILLAIVQFGVVFKDYLTLTDAVREGARKAAVSRSKGAAAATNYVKTEVVKAGSDLKDFKTGDVTVTSTWSPASDVTVRATYTFNINLLGKVVKSGTMSSTATERVE